MNLRVIPLQDSIKLPHNGGWKGGSNLPHFNQDCVHTQHVNTSQRYSNFWPKGVSLKRERIERTYPATMTKHLVAVITNAGTHFNTETLHWYECYYSKHVKDDGFIGNAYCFLEKVLWKRMYKAMCTITLILITLIYCIH